MKQPRTVEQIVKQFYRVISRPVRYASLFYTYYYLVEVENVRELRRDFEETRDELWTAFYNYGVYSVGSELLHLGEEFIFVDEEGILRYLDGKVSKEKVYNVIIEAYPKLSIREKNNTLGTFMFFANQSSITDPINRDYVSVEEFCRIIENQRFVFSMSKRLLEIAGRIFNLHSAKYYWRRSYGGEAWAKICKTLLRRDKTTPTIFVDACWAIQHNTGVWLDKVDNANSEIGIISSIIGYLDRKYMNQEEVNAQVQQTLFDILDSNQRGDMKEVFKYALKYESSLIKYKEYFK